MSSDDYLHWTIATAALSAATNITLRFLIAVAIYRSARIRAVTGAGLRFFGIKCWTLVGFCGGVFALAAYWIMHYSTLIRDDSK